MADNKLTNLILTMGIRFWKTAVDILKIRDLHHCEDVLADLCRVLTISLKPFDLSQDSNLILSLGVSFWLETVRDQNIRDVTHSEAVISYLQGFLDVINQDENVPENGRDQDNQKFIEDNTLKVIKFTKANHELLKNEPEEEIDHMIEADHIEDHFSDNDDWNTPGDQLCLPSPADLQKVKSEQILEEEVSSNKKSRRKKLKHDDLSLICPECGKSLPTKRKMYRHLKYHKCQKKKIDAGNIKERECTICNLMIPANTNIKYHMYKFHDQGAVFCDLCGKKFTCRFHLERHVNAVHTKEKNYLCSICCKKFATDGYLKRHMDSQHSSKFKYNCDQCGKGFMTKQPYEGHVNMHLGIKPYKCEGCGTGFQNQSNLLAHSKKSCKHVP